MMHSSAVANSTAFTHPLAILVFPIKRKLEKLNTDTQQYSLLAINK